MKGALYGPYARQITGTKLKFWFAFDEEETGLTHRYEVHVDTFEKRVKARHRPVYPGRVPTHSSNFNDYLIPSNFDEYPNLAFPRFPRDKLALAAQTLLSPADFADLTRVRLLGQLPTPPRMAHQGDKTCTSAQLF
ncbi:protein of unknown function [Pseudorhizobium banfieldiae]|uniref:Uncharacterized protein n=1 Tax=Pseudorhizobium banfieldiae TaxID=1125847 RepID=L0NEC2_9HYPH|nr:hypothetical protein [Pseudorhizobium banfieldiae]CAD6606122.1 hypothetical protein RNT25_01790 [arsenite-oxidising bacterium NT-25]CCF19136.1 protein of unknown function [Pseudorhizobium banfieldiae]